MSKIIPCKYKVDFVKTFYLSGSECFLSGFQGPRGAGLCTPWGCGGWFGWAWAIL